MRRDVSTAARAPSTRLTRDHKPLRRMGLSVGSARTRPNAVHRDSAATPKKSFTSRPALAGPSEACTELSCLLSP